MYIIDKEKAFREAWAPEAKCAQCCLMKISGFHLLIGTPIFCFRLKLPFQKLTCCNFLFCQFLWNFSTPVFNNWKNRFSFMFRNILRKKSFIFFCTAKINWHLCDICFVENQSDKCKYSPNRNNEYKLTKFGTVLEGTRLGLWRNRSKTKFLVET